MFRTKALQLRILLPKEISTKKIHVQNKQIHPDAVSSTTKHVPVLLNEVINGLAPVLNGKSAPVVVDMTFGCGGHTSAILKEWPLAKIICVDRDPLAFERSKLLASSALFQDGSQRVFPLMERFGSVPTLMKPFPEVDAVLFDLGVSSPQLDDASRGFSLSANGPLDMRMDGNRSKDSPSAADVVNQLPYADLSKIIKIYGEERYADEIARAIVDYRNTQGSITTTRQLAAIIEAVPKRNSATYYHDKLGRYSHPATRTFQALRIFVNDELNDLCSGLDVAHDFLKPFGRALVISFHSLEDRIVKRFFHTVKVKSPEGINDSVFHSRLRNSLEPLSESQMAELLLRRWKPIQFRPASSTKDDNCRRNNIIVPSRDEIASNPRARSAKLRVAEKIE